MSNGNGEVPRVLPPRLQEALRAARAGHHVSFEALRAAVCVYVDELIDSDHADDEIKEHVLDAFQALGDDGRAAPIAWNDERIDELIAWCRTRAKVT